MRIYKDGEPAASRAPSAKLDTFSQHSTDNQALQRRSRRAADRDAVLMQATAVSRSSGTPLDTTTRIAAEQKFGADFSHVRIHTDHDAATAADALGARAFTLGSHIAFAPGEYQPHTADGARLLMHELVHVAQSTGSNTSNAESLITANDAVEAEANALSVRSNEETGPRIHPSLPDTVVARFDTTGAKLQEQRSRALQRGLDPNQPISEPVDPLQAELEEATRNPPPRPPEPTIPGDSIQQSRALERVNPADLWHLQSTQQALQTLAAQTEQRERDTLKAGAQIKHTAENMMAYWKPRFIDSVDYILYRRGGGLREPLLRELRKEELKLMKSAPTDLVDQIEALREKFSLRWQQQVERAANRFLIIADNESQFLTVKQTATPASVYGLPESLEGTVDAATRPNFLSKDSQPVAPSVVEFIKHVQVESGLKIKAFNYPDHEKHSPYFGNITGVGKYSFDVFLQGFIKTNTQGFYEREPLIQFFLAVERAAKNSEIAWIALYNDFEVAKKVNEKIGKRRIGFSGGGSAGAGREGSIHHGPEPYILHIHFNIMPSSLAGQYLAGRNVTPPHIDLGTWK